VKKSQTFTFFIDRALGQKFVATALRQAGAQVEVHDDHFAPEALDVDWLPEVARRGWIVLTKDAMVGKNILEQVAIASSGARVFILAINDCTGEDMANAFALSLPRMERLINSHSPPFIAKVYQFGKVRIWQDRKKLLSTLQQFTQRFPPGRQSRTP
jgi:predicted nuclease of predicted toxin-antitoxin system